MTLAISFATLVKNNNGLFKSEKQASFLISMCRDGVFGTSSAFGYSSFNMYYYCDDNGIYKVEKSTPKKGIMLTWERREEGKVTVQDKKEIKSISRMLKQTQQSIIDTTNYVWADTEMGKEVTASRNTNVKIMIARLLELGVTA